MGIIKRKVDVEIQPSVEEIARIIWDMDCEEQALLLEKLSYHFGKVKINGYMQMLNVAEYVVKRGDSGYVGKFVDDLQEYLGYNALKKWG